MSSWLLDTNIVSELRKGKRCDVRVLTWFESTEDFDLHLSVMTLGEIRKGIERLRIRDQKQAFILEVWLERLRSDFQDRILDISPAVADYWGRLQGIRPIPVVDAAIAATALEHDLTLVTRNTHDFEGLGLRVLNPFSEDL
jgi:toxin FitB